MGLFAPQHMGIFLDQGSNPCLLHWQVDFFLPLSHQGSPIILFLINHIFLCLTKLPTFYSHIDLSLPKHSFCCLHKILHKSHLQDWSPHMWGSDMRFQINNTHQVTSGTCNTISWGTCKFWIPGSRMRRALSFLTVPSHQSPRVGSLWSQFLWLESSSILNQSL